MSGDEIPFVRSTDDTGPGRVTMTPAEYEALNRPPQVVGPLRQLAAELGFGVGQITGGDLHFAQTMWKHSIELTLVLISERDRARRTAVDLENRLAVAEAALGRVRGLHRRYGIYEECDHDHTQGEAGVVYVYELGLVCEDARIGDVCAECCTDDGYLRMDCTDNHDGPCWPCPTLTAIEEGTTDD